MSGKLPQQGTNFSAPHNSQTPRGQIALFFATVVILGAFAFLAFGSLRFEISRLHELVGAKTTTKPEPEDPVVASRCETPIVYNKPHKTAGTKVQNDIFRWANSTNRPAYRCSPFIRQAMLQMRECLPSDLSGCAVVATHMVLSPLTRQIIRDRIGDFLLVTSTRNPRDRLLSLFLQEKRVKAKDIGKDLTELKEFIRQHNPWTLYNYHTGANRVGKCPMSADEALLIPDAVIEADVVIDVELWQVSNEILKWKNLFHLSTSVTNSRSSKDLVLDAEAEELVKKHTCVEDEMHRMFRLRMGSMYEKATGKRCLSNSRYPTDCF